jgi:spore germination protein (amino acid permease)
VENKQIFISNYQLVLLVCAQISVTNLITLPKGLIEVSKQDAWISLFYPIIYCMLLGLILFLLMKRMPGLNIFEISKSLCGKFLGSFLNMIFILYLICDLVINIRLYADYFHTAILVRTPIEYIILIVIALIMYFGSGTIEEVARITSLFFPLIFILLLFIPFFLLNELDLTKLQPILSQGSKAAFNSGLLGMGSLGDIVVFGAFLNNIKNPRGFYVSMKTGILISGLVIIVQLIQIISVFGHISASRIIFIGWFIVQQVHITDFLDRVDLFIISLWLPNLFIKYIILYLAILVGLASFTKSKSYKEFNGLLACLVIMVPILAFNNISDVINSYTYGMVPITFFVHIIFFGVILAALVIRKPHTAQFKDHWKYGRFIWISLFVCAVSIYLSDVLKHETGTNGIILGISFFIFIVIALIFSIREFSKLYMDHNLK